jgi:hypothetical protein
MVSAQPVAVQVREKRAYEADADGQLLLC